MTKPITAPMPPTLCRRCNLELTVHNPGLLRFCMPCLRVVILEWCETAGVDLTDPEPVEQCKRCFTDLGAITGQLMFCMKCMRVILFSWEREQRIREGS